MLCDFADPAMRKWRLVSLYLWDIVDDNKSGNDEVGAKFKEQRWCKFSNEHVELLLIRYYI